MRFLIVSILIIATNLFAQPFDPDEVPEAVTGFDWPIQYYNQTYERDDPHFGINDGPHYRSYGTPPFPHDDQNNENYEFGWPFAVHADYYDDEGNLIGWVYHPARDWNVIYPPGGGGNGDRGLIVRAVADGKVTYSDNRDNAWHGLVIQHNYDGETFYSMYGHVQSIGVERGDDVRKGQPVAEIGNRGGDFTAHLHFEIRTPDHPNPHDYYWNYRNDGLNNRDNVLEWYEDPNDFIPDYQSYAGLRVPREFWNQGEAVIQDFEDDEAGYNHLLIEVTDAPENAVLSDIGIQWGVEHEDWGDLVVTLSTTTLDQEEDEREGHHFILYNKELDGRSGALTGEVDPPTNYFQGEPANQTYYLNVWDWEEEHTGHIDFFYLTLNFQFEGGGGNEEDEHAPVIHQPSRLDQISREIDEGQELTIDFEATDPDGGELDWDIRQGGRLPRGNVADSFELDDNGDGTASFTWTPGFDRARGDSYYNPQFMVIDEDDNSDEIQIYITVVNVPRPPIIHGPTDEPQYSCEIIEGQTLIILFEADDPDGGRLTWIRSQGGGLPENADFDDFGNTNARLHWTPSFNREGDYNPHFRVTDEDDLFDEITVNITVEDSVRPPIIYIQPDSLLTFGDVFIDSSHALPITIRNIGDENLEFSLNIPEQQDHQMFLIPQDHPQQIQPGDDISVEVNFSPTSSGIKNAILTVESNDPTNDNIEIELSGQGVEGPIIELGHYDTEGESWEVVVIGNYVYVADYFGGLLIIDVSDSENPDEVGSFETQDRAYGVCIADNCAYVADGNRGIQVVDVSDPNDPNHLDAVDTPGTALRASVADDYLYVADMNGGLRIIDISDPENLEEVGDYDVHGTPYDVEVVADNAYVASQGAGLQIIDVSNAEDPNRVGGINNPPNTANSVVVIDDYAYVADGNRGLYIIHISDQENPELVGTFNTPGSAFGVFVSDDYVYMADGASGIRVIDVIDPEEPEEVGFYDTQGYTRSVFVNGNIAYVADGGEGLRILDVSYFAEGRAREERYELEINFRENWNLISINVMLGIEYYENEDDQGPNLPLMMEQFRIDNDNHNVYLLKDGRGRFYVPSIPFNNIPHWTVTEGYQVRMEEASVGVWTGTPIARNADIPLREGWNFMAYFPQYDLEMSSPDFYGISPIIDQVDIMKNSRGQFAVPRIPFSNMDDLTEGQGYHIKMSEEDVLNYPPEQEGERIANAAEERFTTTVPSSNNLSLLVHNLNENSLVTAVDPQGNIVGQGTSDSDGQCGIAVWGDDPSTVEKEGLAVGESFKLNGLHVKEFVVGDGLVYEQDAFIAVNVTASNPIPDDYYLSEGYPNPFNSQVRLSYGLPETGLLKIGIFDITGREVTTLINQEQVAGRYNVTWQASDYPSGLYMIKMEAGSFRSVREVVLVK